jgi:hypothetical protein
LHIWAEALDVVPQVCGKMRRIRKKLLEVVAGRIIESEAGSSTELRIKIFEFPFELADGLKNFLFRRRKHAIEPPQHGKRQNNVLILAAFESIANQIRDAPNETNYLTMVQEFLSRQN